MEKWIHHRQAVMMLAVLLVPLSLRSQTRTSRIETPEGMSIHQPPIVQFDSDGISILEAVQLSLEHDPNIKLVEADTNFQRGVSQEQTGAFDTTLRAGGSYDYREQELPQSRKDIEIEKRGKLERELDRNRAGRDAAEELADALARALASPNDQGLVAAIPDPNLRVQIEVIDALLLDPTLNPQVQQELLQVRADFLRMQVENAEQAAVGAVEGFDRTQQTLDRLGDAPTDEWFFTAGVNVAVSKLLRNGMRLSPFFDYTTDGTNFVNKPKDSEFGGKGLENLHTFRVGFDVVVPLARNRGADATGAFEKAAQIDYQASLHSLQFESSLSVLQTAGSYWAARGASAIVEVNMRSVELQERLVQLTRERIDAGEIPQVELARVQASEARALARLENALQRLIEARVGLAVAMGTRATDDERTLPRAGDDFPRAPDGPIVDGEDVVALAAGALSRRQDLMAARMVEDSGSVIVRGAETDLRPVVDAISRVWWTALDEKEISNALDRFVGPSASIELDFEKPMGNNFYKGRLVQREADLLRRDILSADLARVIQLSVVRSAHSLELSAGRVRQARLSVESYERTMDAQFEQFRSGDATLIDAILTEDQQLQARQALISAESEYAQLLVELRFETGSLVTHTATGSVVEQRQLTTVPTEGGTP